tara:strand:- start:2182 stop:2787 length:606 start_codon:yes stop_codon:yes gene_type:complete
LSEDVLSQINRGETGRRELLSFLEDEFVQEARGDNVTVPMILEIFANIRAISNDEEMSSILSHLRRNGIEIDVESSFIPRAIRIRTTNAGDEEESDASQPPVQRRRVRTFAPHPLAVMAARAAAERSGPTDPTNNSIVARYNPTPVLPAPGSIPSSDPRRISLLLSDVLPPVLDLPPPPRYILDRIRQMREEDREDREPTR